MCLGKNLGGSELQKPSKPGKFLFSTLKCELSVIYSICSKTEMLSNEKTCKWSSNHCKWQQRIIKNDKWCIFTVYLENSWKNTILLSLLYLPYNCQVLLMRLHALLFLPSATLSMKQLESFSSTPNVAWVMNRAAAELWLLGKHQKALSCTLEFLICSHWSHTSAPLCHNWAEVRFLGIFMEELTGQVMSELLWTLALCTELHCWALDLIHCLLSFHIITGCPVTVKCTPATKQTLIRWNEL